MDTKEMTTPCQICRTEKPILFSGPMVRAILEGRKTQTRRILKGTTEFSGPYNPAYLECHKDAPGWRQICPYGKPGDRLWVRETWGRFDRDHRIGKTFYYAADTLPGSDGDQRRKDYGYKYKPSIHMPRCAGRITLDITNVRVERVQDISEEDAIAEGVTEALSEDTMSGCPVGGSLYLKEPFPYTARNGFKSLWDSINEKRGYGWDKNPWVWVVSFQRNAA